MLWVSRITHFLSVLAMVGVGLSTPHLGFLYFTGVGLAVLLLIVEHSLVRANDLSKVSLAFFTMNGMISVALGTLGIIDVFMRR